MRATRLGYAVVGLATILLGNLALGQTQSRFVHQARLARAIGGEREEVRVPASPIGTGAEWVCKGTACTLELSIEAQPASMCSFLRQRAGEIASYSHRPPGQRQLTQFTAPELAACNAPLTLDGRSRTAELVLARTPSVISRPWHEARETLLNAGFRFVDIRPYFVCSDRGEWAGTVEEQNPGSETVIAGGTATIDVIVVDDSLPILDNIAREYHAVEQAVGYIESLGLSAEVSIDWDGRRLPGGVVQPSGEVRSASAWTQCVEDLQRHHSTVHLKLFRPLDRTEVPSDILGSECEDAVRRLVRRRITPNMFQEETADPDTYWKIVQFGFIRQEGEIIPTEETNVPLMPIPEEYADGRHSTTTLSFGVPRDFIARVSQREPVRYRGQITQQPGEDACAVVRRARRLYEGQ